jgi:hypothetical protein
MYCKSCYLLSMELVRVRGIYAKTVRAVVERTGISRDEYMKLRTAADEARLDAQIALLELRDHEQGHAAAAALPQASRGVRSRGLHSPAHPPVRAVPFVYGR